MALDDGSCSNNGGRPQAGLDRLSDLPDDILVLVLERLCDGDDNDDVRPLARTCVLSKRWRSLPLMVSRLKVTVRSFLPPEPSTLPVRCLHEATSKFTDALRFFLATPAGGGGGGHGQRGDTKRRIALTLRFYVTKHHHRLLEIGRLLSSAVRRGEVQALAIVVDTPTAEDDISFLRLRRRPRQQHGDDDDDDGEVRLGLALCYARRFMRLFRAAAPGAVVGSALTQLTLRHLCFHRASDLEPVLRACEALETLHLDGCCIFAAAWSATLRIDAPRSRLRDLEVTGCGVENVHVVRLPRLLRLAREWWPAQACPVTFGAASAPALKCVTLVNRSAPGQMSFKLSDLQLENANPVEYLCLDFAADKVWVRPEKWRNLRAAFSKLKKLHVRNIFHNADISWTMFLIKAAPFLELIDIHVSNDICSGGGEDDAQDLEWDEEAVSDQSFEHHHLHTVKIRGATADDARFLRLVLERAVNLNLLLLLLNDDCIRIAGQQEDPSSAFPEDKDGIDAFVTRLKDGIPTSARIVVQIASNQEFEYLVSMFCHDSIFYSLLLYKSSYFIERTMFF